MRLFACLLALPIIFWPATIYGAPKDVAELFPADSLAYLEMCKPGETAKDIAAFFKGSILENPLPTLDKMRETNGAGVREAGLFTAFFGPEMVKEANRFQGVAVALTGFDKRGNPEFTAVVLTGASQLPGFVMRSFLASHPGLRKVDLIEEIGLYVERANQFEDPLLGNPGGRRQAKDTGPVFAYDPGIVLIGSNKVHVASAIRRWKQKEKSASLAENPAFKKAVDQRQAPGLFLFADAKRLLEKQTAPAANRKGPEPFATELLRKLLPPADVETCTARLEFKPQGLDLRCSLKLAPKSNNALANLLGGPGLEIADLHGLGKESPLAVVLNFPPGGQRLPALLDLLERLAKASGTLGPTASEIVQELEEKKTLAPGSLAKVDRLSIVMPPIASWPKGSLPLPTFILHADTSEALESLEAAVPAVLELLGGKKADPVTETIDGVKVRTLEPKASPMGSALHYARREKLLAIGVDRRFVAACMTADPARSLAAVPDVNEMLKSAGKVSLLGAWNWSATLLPAKSEKAGPKNPPPPFPIDGPFEPEGRPAPPALPLEVFESLRGLPPLVITLSSQDDELRLELRQRDPRGLRIAAIYRWFEWYVKTRPMMYGQPFDVPGIIKE